MIGQHHLSTLRGSVVTVTFSCIRAAMRERCPRADCVSAAGVTVGDNPVGLQYNLTAITTKEKRRTLHLTPPACRSQLTSPTATICVPRCTSRLASSLRLSASALGTAMLDPNTWRRSAAQVQYAGLVNPNQPKGPGFCR